MNPASYAAAILLRGVNVNRITMRSAALKDCLRQLDGVDTAATVLASGNVMVTTTLTPAALKAAAESALRGRFGYDAWVIVLTRDELAALVRQCPYPADDETTHAYITVSSDPAALDEIEADAAALGSDGGPLIRLASGALAWQCPAGQSVQAPLARLFARARYASATTTRNLRTLQRMLGIPAEVPGTPPGT